jgi:hypothetical protein
MIEQRHLGFTGSGFRKLVIWKFVRDNIDPRNLAESIVDVMIDVRADDKFDRAIMWASSVVAQRKFRDGLTGEGATEDEIAEKILAEMRLFTLASVETVQ